MRLRNVRVLAAEDNELNQLVLEEMLTDEGAAVTFAADGAQAVQHVRTAPDAFDVVLCDVEMPVMDGYAATRAIHQLAPALPVVGLTAHAFDSARESGKAAGMIDYLTKPFTLGDLVETILRALATARQTH